MTLRERLAIAICAAPEHAFPPMIRTLDGRLLLPSAEAPLLVLQARCVCARDQRIPVMTTLRCADCLAKADQVIDLFPELGLLRSFSANFSWPQEIGPFT